MNIRRANETDSKRLFDWRNDELTRAASINTREINWESHQRWFALALQNELLVIYLAQNDESADALGMCRFDIDAQAQSAEVSINVNPEFRARGVGKALLTASIARFAEDCPRVKSLTATVKTGNVASVKLFDALGFKLVSPVSEEVLKLSLSL